MSVPFHTRNDIPATTREKLIRLLNTQLLDLIDLQSQTKFAHWNVRGPNFIALHELFDKLAADLAPEIDDTAERASALGGLANGTVRHSAGASRLTEFPANVFEGSAVVTALAERYAALAKTTRTSIDEADALEDRDTADLFTGTSRMLDKALWFLEAHLEKK